MHQGAGNINTKLIWRNSTESLHTNDTPFYANSFVNSFLPWTDILTRVRMLLESHWQLGVCKFRKIYYEKHILIFLHCTVFSVYWCCNYVHFPAVGLKKSLLLLLSYQIKKYIFIYLFLFRTEGWFVNLNWLILFKAWQRPWKAVRTVCRGWVGWGRTAQPIKATMEYRLCVNGRRGGGWVTAHSYLARL